MANMKDVKPPEKLTERKVKVAKAWVNNELNERLPQSEFCKKYNLSTATLAKWKGEDIDFQNYVKALKGELISNDEVRAYQVAKQHIINRVNSDNPTEKEIQQFLEHFDYVVQYEKQKAMESLGINKYGEASNDARTLEQKRNVLLSRLKG